MNELSINIGYKPRKWQWLCHVVIARFMVLALHRRAGKTEYGLAKLIDRALRFTLDLGMFFYVAPFLKQAKLIAWARLKQMVEPLRQQDLVDVNESELFILFKHNGAMIRIYGADNPDGMRGVRLDGVVMDEVAQMKPEVWDDIVQPALSDRKGWADFIGTPNGVNLFSELFFKAKSLPDWHSAAWTVYDTDALDLVEVERLRRDMSEASFAREYLCDFTAAGDNQLINLGDVDAATRREYKKEDYQFAAKVIGVDPARFGDDRSVIFRRQGLVAFQPNVYRGLDNMDLAGRVVQEIEQWQPDAVFVDAGAGSGVIDRLRQLGNPVIEINFGGRPTDMHYANKRAEMWFSMRDWLLAGGAIPGSHDLRQDLGAPTYSFDSANRAVLESKDEIKKRGLPSPDLGDALALTFAQPVQPKFMNGLFGRASGRNKTREYNPYATI